MFCSLGKIREHDVFLWDRECVFDTTTSNMLNHGEAIFSVRGLKMFLGEIKDLSTHKNHYLVLEER